MEKLKALKAKAEHKALEFWTGLESGNLKKEHFAFLMLGLLVAVPAFAADSDAADPWSNFTTTLINWATGNLGKLLALITVIVGSVMALASHSVKPLAYSVILAVFIGGIVGIAKLFFNAGGTAFGTSW